MKEKYCNYIVDQTFKIYKMKLFDTWKQIRVIIHITVPKRHMDTKTNKLNLEVCLRNILLTPSLSFFYSLSLSLSLSFSLSLSLSFLILFQSFSIYMYIYIWLSDNCNFWTSRSVYLKVLALGTYLWNSHMKFACCRRVLFSGLVVSF
jgi:hypothetical protein